MSRDGKVGVDGAERLEAEGMTEGFRGRDEGIIDVGKFGKGTMPDTI